MFEVPKAKKPSPISQGYKDNFKERKKRQKTPPKFKASRYFKTPNNKGKNSKAREKYQKNRKGSNKEKFEVAKTKYK